MKLKKVLKQSAAFGLAALLVAAAPVSVSAASWQQNSTGWWWQEDDNSYPTSTWKSIYGKWFYFDSYGYMLGEGWHWIDGKCYYMYSGGDMAENTWVDGSYVDASGAWVPDAEPAQWRSYAGRWWYTFPDGSYPENEWAAINGAWYYFGEDGWMLDKGWHWIDGKCYYMYSGGAMAESTWIGGDYVNASGEWVVDKWVASGNQWWYRYADGSYPTNTWKYIDGAWYYFDGSGWMLGEGWHWIGDTCYYMYADGRMASDTWIDHYYVDASGAWIPEKCNHDWEEKYEDIEHPEAGHYENVLISPEEGHYEKVLVKDQWTEYKLIKEAEYEDRWVVDKEAWTEKVHNPAKDKYEIHYLCNGCKKDFGDDYEGIMAHNKEQMLQGNLACGGWHEADVLVEKGYDIIEHPEEGHYEHVKIADAVYQSIWHPAEYEDRWIVDKEAVYEDKWVVDKEAWTEHKLIGYVCSHCGESKEAEEAVEEQMSKKCLKVILQALF